jgi:hypothetical protein
MALLDAPDLYGNTLFCDDIRAEADGKVTYVGVYGSHMFVHNEFPVTLPKFAFGITFVQKKRIFDPNIGIRIFLPQDPDDAPSIKADAWEQTEGTVLANLPPLMPGAVPAGQADQAIVALHANLIFAPFTITQPGVIKVRVERRGDLVRLGAISVGKAPQAAPPNVGIPKASTK